jgi:hypothetical protein
MPTAEDVKRAVTPEFYTLWCHHAKIVRPHQTPPTFEQVQYLLCEVLLPDQAMQIIHQFNEAES